MLKYIFYVVVYGYDKIKGRKSRRNRVREFLYIKSFLIGVEKI